MNYRIILFIVMIFAYSCKNLKARRPKQQGTKNFYAEVIKKSKKMNALERKRIEKWIEKDSIHNITSSPQGYWYYYVKKDSLSDQRPLIDDTVEIEYNVFDFNGKEIYGNQKKSYRVDKEDFIPALQDGIKLMKKDEVVTFIIPSYRAFGVMGDGHKIGINQSIISTVTLIDIKTDKKK